MVAVLFTLAVGGLVFAVGAGLAYAAGSLAHRKLADIQRSGR